MKGRNVTRAIGLTLAGLFLLFLVADLLLARYAERELGRARARFEREAGPLRLAEYAPQEPAARDNAAAWIRAGTFGLLLDEAEEELVGERSGQLGASWSERQRILFEDLLVEHRSAIELLTRGIDRNGSSFGIEYSRGPQLDLPNFIELLKAARVLTVASDLRLAEGRTDEALLFVRALAAMTASLRHESLVISLLVGNAVERQYLRQVHALLQALDDPRALDVVRGDLELVETWAVPLRRVLAAEGAMGREGMQELTRHLIRDRAVVNLAAGRWAPELTEASLLDGFTGLTGLSELPLAGRDRAALDELWRPSSRLPLVDAVATTLIPNLLDAIRKEQAVLAARRLALLGVELRLAFLADGTVYPPQLEAPPVSPFTGETARWEIRENGSASLSFPATLEAWRQGENAGARAIPPLLEWTLVATSPD